MSGMAGRSDDASLLQQQIVVQGLRRLWVSVTVLDPNNRIHFLPIQTFHECIHYFS